MKTAEPLLKVEQLKKYFVSRKSCQSGGRY